MSQRKRPAQGTVETQRIFNTATVAVAGLYVATGSIIVTVIGAAASTVVACWSIWLARQG